MRQQHANEALLHARAQGLHAVQQFAEANLPLVALMVRRCPSDGREPEELYQQGCVGLMKAIARYDPSQGTTFSTYAASMILGEMRMLNRLHAPIHIPRPEREQRQRIQRAQDKLTSHLGREPTVTELAAMLRMDAAEMMLLMERVTVTSTDSLTEDGTPLHEFLPDQENWMARVEMQDLVSRLSHDDQQLLRLRYVDGLSQSETALRMGRTQLQISRREAVIRRILQKEWYSA